MEKKKAIAIGIAVIVIVIVVALAVQLLLWGNVVFGDCPEGQELVHGECVQVNYGSDGIPQPTIPSNGVSPPEVPF